MMTIILEKPEIQNENAIENVKVKKLRIIMKMSMLRFMKSGVDKDQEL
jgi:hypothetical protein